jgi:formylglycine-generating enzyme required for sulfatase activity
MQNSIKWLEAMLRIAIIALIAVIGFSFTACGDGGDGKAAGAGGRWLISYQSTSAITDGTPSSYSSTSYSWITYRYTNETNYEEEYTTYSSNSTSDSYSEYHYTRNGQSSHSTTETIYPSSPATSYSTTSSYDLASGFASSSTTISPSGTSTTVYVIELISDTGTVKTYKYYPIGSKAYSLYEMQNGRTLKVSYYDENQSPALRYTTTYTESDNTEIRSKLPNFTLANTQYYSSSYSYNSSYQTVEIVPKAYEEDIRFRIQVKTFNDGVLSSETDYSYINYDYYKQHFIANGDKTNTDSFNIPNSRETDSIWIDEKYYPYERWGDYRYIEMDDKIIILKYTKVGGNANIPAQINGKAVTDIGIIVGDSTLAFLILSSRRYGYPFRDSYKLTSVTIPNSVTSIVGVAFSGCWSLTSVTFQGTIAENKFGSEIWSRGDLVGDIYLGSRKGDDHEYMGMLSPFAGDLREKYLVGGPGTYTRMYGASEWTKQGDGGGGGGGGGGDPTIPVSIEMVPIQGGTFTMGSPTDEPERMAAGNTSETEHQVTLSDFYMSKHEVTQGQYKAVTGMTIVEQQALATSPSTTDYGRGDNFPMYSVSWYDALVFCNKLSVAEDLNPAYEMQTEANTAVWSTDTATWGTIPGSSVTRWNNVRTVTGSNGYRLPTEAQWEYACRAGTRTPFNTGNNITTAQANYDGNYPYNDNPKGINLNRTSSVGSYAPNTLGLYDMHGNVAEWCWDRLNFYPSEPQTDPVGSTTGDRVYRGGSWIDIGLYLRSAYRYRNASYGRSSSIGFRLARPAQ